MDFSAIFQIRTKKVWWMDVIFYFVISSLVATVACYFIFMAKNGMIRNQIDEQIEALKTVGTNQQKEQEREVISYQKKVNDFSNLLMGHEFASNIFVFLKTQTLPNVWFKQFVFDGKNKRVQLSGEADSLDAFSRQVAVLEKNKYVAGTGTMNSSLGAGARAEFNLDVALNQDIFNYLAVVKAQAETNAPVNQPPVQENQPPASGEQKPVANEQQQTSPSLSSEKLITSFHLVLNPEVVGTIDQENHKITLNVPFGTDIRTLTPSIVVSSGATVLPASHVAQNFTSPVIYAVTAQDSTVQNYEVRVIVAPEPPPAAKPNQSGFIALIIIMVIAAIIAIAAGIFLFIKNRSKKQI